MAFCGNCGNELSGKIKFCPNCGAPVGDFGNSTEVKNLNSINDSLHEEILIGSE